MVATAFNQVTPRFLADERASMHFNRGRVTGYSEETHCFWFTNHPPRTQSPQPGRYNSRVAAMRHLMPIVTPRLVLRPPTLGDLDSIQTAKEDAWPDLQRWMAWAFDNQRSRKAMENSIRRTMDYQSQAGIALAENRGLSRISPNSR
jgi:hypothetical protein